MHAAMHITHFLTTEQMRILLDSTLSDTNHEAYSHWTACARPYTVGSGHRINAQQTGTKQPGHSHHLTSPSKASCSCSLAASIKGDDTPACRAASSFARNWTTLAASPSPALIADSKPCSSFRLRLASVTLTPEAAASCSGPKPIQYFV